MESGAQHEGEASTAVHVQVPPPEISNLVGQEGTGGTPTPPMSPSSPHTGSGATGPAQIQPLGLEAEASEAMDVDIQERDEGNETDASYGLQQCPPADVAEALALVEALGEEQYINTGSCGGHN